MLNEKCKVLSATRKQHFLPGDGKKGREVKVMNKMNKFEDYEEYLIQRELAERTIKIYIRQAKQLHEYFGEKAITKKEMLAYKKYLLKQNRKVSSTNLYIVAANSYLRYIGLGDCTIKTERIQRRNSLENVINMEEYRRILACAKESRREKYYYIVRVLVFTGIRVSELAFLTVEALSAGKFVVVNKRKTRDVYLPERLIRELNDYCKAEQIGAGVIFMGNRQKAISRVAVYKMLIRLADIAEVEKEKVHPHSFRHLFAITYMKQYANLSELADLLGHSSLETTRIYTTTTAEEKRSRLNELDF